MVKSVTISNGDTAGGVFSGDTPVLTQATDANLDQVITNKEIAVEASTTAVAAKDAALVSETNAATSETNAATSETNAATSETNAAASESAAATSASEALASQQAAEVAQGIVEQIYDQFDDRYLGAYEDDPLADNDGNALVEGSIYWNTVGDELRFFNGFSWESPEAAASQSAANALTSANNAADSETAAALSETNAATSETNAASSATASANSASAANLSETAAAQSKTNAATSETNASASETAAATSETNAANSATAAATSETNAASSETNAAASQSAALASQTAAASSATAAATSESNASTSESNAAASESAAALSESNANSSRIDAASSASAAQSSAFDANISELAAASSEANAAVSEANAATSETNAATSETNASSSASAANVSQVASATSESNAATSETNAATSAAEALASETAAATSELNAAASETAAATSESNAASSATAAATSETNAAASETAAATSESNAATSEANAATSETNAESYKNAAQAAQTAAEAVYDTFDDRYLGPKATSPTTDNDGDALVAGSLYFNTTQNQMKVYDGASWLDSYTTLSGALLANQNLAELQNTSTARDNLGLGTVATTDASAYATAAQGALADSAIQPSDAAVLTSVQVTGGTGTQGTLSWNTDEETVDLEVGTATLQLGQELYYHVRNSTASPILNGTPLMVTGTLGASGRLTVAPMDGTSAANAKYFIGLATEEIAAGADGKVTSFGKVRGIDTQALGYTQGTVLWVSGTNVGELTDVEPTTGVKLPVAFCVYEGNNGTVFVRSTTGVTLEEAHDVSLESSIADNEVLAYDSATGLWKNQTVAEANLATFAQGANADTAYGWGDHGAAGYFSASGGTITGATVVDGSLETTDGLIVGGNLTVNGTTTTVNAENLAVADNLIYLNDGNTTANIDLGIGGNYNDGTYAHTGIFRDATDGRWKVFDSYTPELDAATDIDTSHASFSLANMQADTFYGSLSGNATSADTADKWDTARTITLGGDLSGNVSIDGTSNVTLTATVNANSVALGTDTTGDYAGAVAAGNGVVVTGVAGEGTTFTVAHADTSSQGSLTALTGANVVSDVDLDTYGHVTGLATRALTLGDLGYTGATDANNYVHPSYAGDDFSVDTGVLTGATVVSDIDINVTTDASGHVTDANGSVATRTLTLGDLGFTGDSNANYYTYTHPSTHPATMITTTDEFAYSNSTNVQDVLDDLDQAIANVNAKDPVVTLTGAVTGSGTMTNLGSVSIATTATADPTLTLAGDLSGSATFTNLGNATLTATVANDSHTHDGRYYTESELGAVGTSNTTSGAYKIGVYDELGNSNSTNVQDVLDDLDQAISNVAGKDPVITLTGAVTGSGTMSNLGNVSIATTATADPTLTITGDASGSATFTNLGNASLSLTINDDSHNHVISNVDGLQAALNGKQAAGTYNTIIGTDADINTSGATIIDNLYMTDGVITSHGTRNLTAADIGAAASSHSHSYLPLSGGTLTGTMYGTTVDVSSAVKIGGEVVLQESTDRADLLQVTSTTSSWAGIQIRNSSNEGRWSFMTDGTTGGIYNDEGNQWHIQFIEGGETRLYHAGSEKLNTLSSGIYVTGNFTASGNVTAYSDARLKENLEVIPNALDKVSNLTGYTYDRNDIETKRQTGVIAQEVLEVLPESVTESEDGIYGVNYGSMVGLLIEAIKELKAEVDELKGVK
jgi:hypothetical protein